MRDVGGDRPLLSTDTAGDLTAAANTAKQTRRGVSDRSALARLATPYPLPMRRTAGGPGAPRQLPPDGRSLL